MKNVYCKRVRCLNKSIFCLLKRMLCVCVDFMIQPNHLLFILFFFFSVFFHFSNIFDFRFRLYLLGRGRRSTIVGVEAGVFLVTLVLAEAAGAALPDRICRFGELSRFVETGPTDCDRSALYLELNRYQF